MNKINILGINFNNLNMEEAIEQCNGFLKSNKCNMIVTPNPEIIMETRKDEEFKRIINNSDLVVSDGIGVIIASKIMGTKLQERVAGFDLICNLFEDNTVDKKAYLLGSKPGIAEKAKIEIEKKYKVKVVKTRDGYFKSEQEEEIINDINNSGANILLVGTGMKKQENFINKYKDKLNVKIAIGCGGSIDVFSGEVKRAPMFFQKSGLEWFYRLVKQPTRIKRMMALPKFLLIAILEKKNKIS